MNRRILWNLGAAGAALLIFVALFRASPDSPRRSGRRSPAPPPMTEPSLPDAAARKGALEPVRDVPVPTLRRLLAVDPEEFLERIEGETAWREAAYRRLFPHPGELAPDDRKALLDSLWAMTLSGRRSAAALLGRFEWREPLLGQVLGFLRSTGDAELAATIVEGMRECPANLKSGGADLAGSVAHHLSRRPHPTLLGALADLARLCPDALPSEGMLKLFAAHLDPNLPEDFRLHAVSGLAAWPEAGMPALLARFPVEPSAPVRLAILRFASRRPEGPGALLEALREDSDPDVRRFAAESMRLAGDRASIPALERLAAGETDRQVVRALRDSIAVLARQK
jgi:hypothetical protein